MKSRCHILLVDDDVTSAYLTQALLEEISPAAAVTCVTNGEEALALFKPEREAGCPDLVLLDLNMPVMDGPEFLEAFQRLSLPKAVRVVVLSTFWSPQQRARLERYPIAGYAEKPLSETHLQELLQQTGLVECVEQQPY